MLHQADATDDDFYDPDRMIDPMQQTLPINVEEFIEEYEYARDEYKNSKADSDKCYWDGYLMALEKISGDILINI